MTESQHITLRELQRRVKSALEGQFALPLWVSAEISEIKVNYSGHCYLELVEKGGDNGVPTAQARAVVWRSNYPRIAGYFEAETGQRLAAGIKILAKALVTYHELYGFSLQITDIDPSYTLGDMERQRQQTIAQLQQEGVWDMNREAPMPAVVQRVAIVSSANAAGYQDFCKELARSPYRFELTLFDAFMQGEAAEESIIEALCNVAARPEKFDAVVLIRGGGSRSDLNCFNAYRLCAHVAQFPLPVVAARRARLPLTKYDALTVSEDKRSFTVAGSGFAYRIDKGRGMLSSVFAKGRECLGGGARLSIWRAPIDNDRNVVGAWKAEGYNTAGVKVYKTELAKTSDTEIVVRVEFSMAGVSYMPILSGVLEYRVTSDGVLTVHAGVNVRETAMPLPRFGMEFILPRGSECLEYFGKGEQENYEDMCRSARIGLYKSTVTDQYFPYIRPQETGNHTAARWLRVTNKVGGGLQFTGRPTFNFSALHFTAADLETAMYTRDLRPREETIVRIDYKQTGVGSASCGVKLAEKYQFKEKFFDFEFEVKPL